MKGDGTSTFSGKKGGSNERKDSAISFSRIHVFFSHSATPHQNFSQRFRACGACSPVGHSISASIAPCMSHVCILQNQELSISWRGYFAFGIYHVTRQSVEDCLFVLAFLGRTGRR